jgi:hypothetical protein
MNQQDQKMLLNKGKKYQAAIEPVFIAVWATHSNSKQKKLRDNWNLKTSENKNEYNIPYIGTKERIKRSTVNREK